MGICCCESILNEDGTYDPSSFTQKMAVTKKSDYVAIKPAPTKYTGNAPILVVCTDEGLMKMKNGKVFSTGNHPIEMLVPMMHMRDAGFKFEFATDSGKKVHLEMWAYPTEDEAVKVFHDEVSAKMDSPKKIDSIVSLSDYAGIFIPGGHGAMINLPENAALGNLLHEAHDKGIPTVTLCHGPAALLSTTCCADGNSSKPSFPYKGYKIMCFTDKTDALTPKLGYLPGIMPWKCQSTLEGEGITVLNKGESGATNVDRELITGDSPKAAQNLGIVAAPLLVKWATENRQ